MPRRIVPAWQRIIIFFIMSLGLLPEISIAQTPTNSIAETTSRSWSISIGVADPILTLDWQKAFDPGALVAARAVGETLYRRYRTGETLPWLAQSLPEQVSPGVFRIRLKDSIAFQDGTSLQTSDVIFTCSRLKSRALNLPTRRLFEDLSSVTAGEKGTVTIVFGYSADRLAELLARPESAILSEMMVSRLGAAYGVAGVMGTGPYSVREWDRGKNIVLEANPDYWGKKISASSMSPATRHLNPAAGATPPLSTGVVSDSRGTRVVEPAIPGLVHIDYIADQDLLAKKLLQNQITLAIGADSSIRAAIERKKDKFSLLWFARDSLINIYLNRQVAPFDRPALRKALSMAIDRQAILGSAIHGLGVAAESPLPPSILKSSPESVSEFCSFLPEKAIQLLKENGFPQGTPLKFTLAHTATTELTRLSRELAARMSSAGIEMTLRPMERDDLRALIHQRSAGEIGNDGWQAILEDWNDWRRLGDPFEFLKLLFQSGSRYNKTGFNDSTVDQMLTATSASASSQVLPSILKRIIDDGATIPLLSLHRIVGVNLSLCQGITWSVEGVPYLNECQRPE